MEIRHKKVEDLTAIEYKACYDANYGPDGLMQNELVTCRNKNYMATGEVIMLWDGPDNTTRSLIGWCLLTPVRGSGTLWASQWNRKVAKYTAQFWIKSNHRKRGYGKILMDEVQKLDPCPHVFPHSVASAAMFVNYKVTASQHDHEWLRRAKNLKKRRAA